MSFKIFIVSLLWVVVFGSPIIYNQPYNPPSYLPDRAFLTPPRAVTTLNTFVPRQLIPSAPPRSRIIRVYENNQPQRIFTLPQTFRTIAPAPTTTRRPQPFVSNVSNTNNNPRYAFNYNVDNNRTGDIKSQRERLENGVVTGEYSLQEADGSFRRVTYRADDINGFNAVVERTNVPIPQANNNNMNANNNSQFTIFTQ